MTRVLVVEDDEPQRTVIAAHLGRAGLRVVAVDSIAAAMTVIQQHGAPDVAVLDVGLPDGDGYQLLARLRAEAPNGAEIPAVILSAGVKDTDIARGHAAGAAYLTKPFIASALLAAIDRVVAERRGTPAGW